MASSRKSSPARDLLARVSAVIRQYVRRGDRLVAGLSGGIDSMVLADLLRRLSGGAGFDLAALHVNHQINPAAASWARFCRAYCARHGVPLTVIKVNVPAGASVEAAARIARYQALAKAPAEFIVLAHNLDDQAETVFLQLLRGAGVKGTSAMPVLRTEDRGARIEEHDKSKAKRNVALRSSILHPAILRPLLDISRSEIEAYARSRKLEWIEDDSNDDTGFDRNFMRHRVLPVIAQRFPGYRKTLARASRNFAEAAQLIDELALADAQFTANGLNVAALRRLSAARAKNVVRHYLASNGVMMPNATRLAECVRQVRQPRRTQTVIDMGEHELRCFGDELCLVGKSAAPPRDYSRAWTGATRQGMPELGGTLVMAKSRGRGLSLAKITAAPVSVRLRRGGERLSIDAKRPRRSLTNLLQEARVPPWLRDRLPLIYCGESLICVPGIGIAPAFQARRDEQGVMPSWVADSKARVRVKLP